MFSGKFKRFVRVEISIVQTQLTMARLLLMHNFYIGPANKQSHAGVGKGSAPAPPQLA